MQTAKTTFALFFGNRGFFPASLQAAARKEMAAALKALGHGTIVLDPRATRHGAVETPREGQVYAEFLRANRGRFGGVVVCLPNFGDETGAIAALKDCGVPILLQAYPDELDKMGPASRRDAFCGKFSIMDVFYQNGLPFTALAPHTAHPAGASFAENIAYFDRLCRAVAAVRNMVVGAIGARTTPFKTVRIDELALQRHGITMETYDLSGLFARMKAIKKADKALAAKAGVLKKLSSWRGVPGAALENLARLGVVLDAMVAEGGLDAVAIRCWTEMQTELGISPCVVMGEMNERGIPASCEVDVGSAVTMRALAAASGGPAACLDWNNNYGEQDDRCILFHCGPVPMSMMAGPGRISEHCIIMNAVGPGRSYGCNTGRIRAMPMTFGNMMTEAGRLKFYLGQGRFTDEPIPGDFFGCAGVAQVPEMQKVLQTIGYLGHRHHVAVAPGHVAAPVQEAMVKYLGCDVTMV